MGQDPSITTLQLGDPGSVGRPSSLFLLTQSGGHSAGVQGDLRLPWLNGCASPPETGLAASKSLVFLKRKCVLCLSGDLYGPRGVKLIVDSGVELLLGGVRCVVGEHSGRGGGAWQRAWQGGVGRPEVARRPGGGRRRRRGPLPLQVPQLLLEERDLGHQALVLRTESGGGVLLLGELLAEGACLCRS